MERKELDKKTLRSLPSVHRLLQEPTLLKEGLPLDLVTQDIRFVLNEIREKIQNHQEKICVTYDSIVLTIQKKLEYRQKHSYSYAMNATGVILHTGLGRAVLPQAVLKNIIQQLQSYTIVEVNRKSGKRNKRDESLRQIICDLTGAEDATVVNNNAAALILAISTLAKDQEIIVSNGQLVEIGGSFRIPEIIAQSGAKLVSVGCTNKVHLQDYQNAISENTSALLHVHTSNYQVMGFTKSVSLSEMSKIAQKNGIYLIEDAGSGALFDLSPYGYNKEPVIQDCLSQGADIVTFSGDKLLGGCQAGIIVGKKDCIEKMRQHPLARAFRVDKISLIALESIFKLYYDSTKVWSEIPTLRMLQLSPEKIKIRAQSIANKLSIALENCLVEVAPSFSCMGSGAFPVEQIPSYSVTLEPSSFSAQKLSQALRLQEPPLFTRIQNDKVLLDPRTLREDEDPIVIQVTQNALKELQSKN